MNNRKILGTILGIIMYGFCIIYFTYAYYNWRSEETELGFSIEDITINFETGSDVEVNNMGPVLDYNDGVYTEFNAINETNINVPIKITLDITSISENLKTKYFKYILLRDSTGGVNYTEKVVSGNFSTFDTGINSIIGCEMINAKSTYSYKFIVYIDGNVKNNTNMQNNRLESALTIEDSEVSYMTTFTSSTDESYYKNDAYRESIKNVYFVDYIDTNDAVESWNMTNKENKMAVISQSLKALSSNNNNIGDVTSWVVNTEDNSYDLYIGSNDLIVSRNISELFSGLTNVESISFDNFDTSVITDMSHLFENCSNLVNIDLSNFNTANVTKMSYMFRNCTNLIELDLSSFDTSNVTKMDLMFSGLTNLQNIDVSSFNTSKVTTMQNMFLGCSNLTSLNISNFDTSNVTSMSAMFNGCSKLTSIDLSNFDTSNVRNMNTMFLNCKKLLSIDLSNFDTSNVTTMNSMFSGCTVLKELDLSNFNTGNVTKMEKMFQKCENLLTLDLSNFDTSNVTDMSYMFWYCTSLISIDLSNFNTNKVTSMKYMFYECYNLVSVDVSNFDTSNVTSMSAMFCWCHKLSDLDVSSFNTSKVTNMASMFNGCNSLTSLDLSNFDTSQVTNMLNMFHSCYKLNTSITIKNPNITDYTSMFAKAATEENSQITVNYISSTSTLVDDIINTKSTNSNVIKGSLV